MAFAPEITKVFNRLRTVFLMHGMDNATLGYLFGDFAAGGIVILFHIFPGIEVIQNAIEFVEPVVGRQVFVPVAKVVLAELSVGIAVFF